MPTLLQTLKAVDAIQDAYQAANGENLAAETAKLVAMLGIGIATESAIRTVWPAIRLGYAITGRIDQWEKISGLGGWIAAELTGVAIDWINEQSLGSALYDSLHTGISPTVPTLFTTINATSGTPITAPLLRDPLSLDLDNDGLETVGINPAAPILFDHTGTGVKTATGWLNGDDGFLALDRNGNGTIDNGTELFGDSTRLPDDTLAHDGFDALAAQDTNADGLVNSQDSGFGALRIWRDLNQNGLSETNELQTLNQAGIASITVAKTENAVLLANGNQIADLGTYTRTDGSTGGLGETAKMADIDLASNPFYRRYTDSIPLTQAAQALPDMQGSGLVRNLREAASLQTPEGTALATKLADYAAAPTREAQRALLPALVDAWTATGDLPARQGGIALNSYWGRWTIVNGVPRWTTGINTTPLDPASPSYRQIQSDIAVVEAFNGQRLSLQVQNGSDGQPASVALWNEQIDVLTRARSTINDSVYDGLVLQTRLKPYLDNIALTISETGIDLDYAGVATLLTTRKSTDPTNTAHDLVDLVRLGRTDYIGKANLALVAQWLDDPSTSSIMTTGLTGAGLLKVGTWNGAEEADLVFGGNGADTLSGNGGDDVLVGRGGNDTLNGSAGDDTLMGEAGDDYLAGGDGTDTLTGGDGTDNLNGGNGNDTLDGGIGNDTLTGGAGIDTYIVRDGHDTVNAYDAASGWGDTLILEGVNPDGIGLSRSNNDLILTKSNGETVRLYAYFASAHYQFAAIRFADGTSWDAATVAAQTVQVNGGVGNDILTGHDGGANIMNGYAGADTLTGGDRNDTLDGGDDNDTLNGNAGDDILLGQAGDDYFYGGDGTDTLSGGAGNDNLNGGNGNDLIDGGIGTDTMAGGLGIDTYIVRDGHDTVNAYDATTGWADTLVLEGVNPGDIGLSKSNNDLILTKSNGETVRLYAYFASANYQFAAIRFADGTSWDAATVAAQMVQVNGGAGNDVLTGHNGGTNTMNGYAGADTLTGGDRNDTLNGGDGNDTLNGSAGDDTLMGETGDDYLTGGDGADTLIGGAGNDNLNGSNGNDTLDGGVGNDTLTGGAGIDTYIVREGHDTVNASDAGNWVDTLILEGVNPADILLSKNGSDLIFTKRNGETVRLSNYFASANYQFAAIRFADGTNWDATTVAAQSLPVNGGTGNDLLTGHDGGSNVMNGYAGVDTLNGGNRNDILNGGDGNDTLNGNAGDDALDGGAGDDTLNGGDGTDTLIGGAGNDNLNGGIGNDTLDGGVGNDTLTGGAGVDTYIVRDGNDTVNASDAGNWVDTLILEGVNPTDIGLSKTGSDLILTKTNGETVRLSNYFVSANYQLAAIRFADGTSWDATTVAAQDMQVSGTAGNDNLTGRNGGSNFINGYAGVDTLNGGDRNDIVNGGDGNDTLNGYAGDDALDGGASDDTLNGGDDTDTLIGGNGNDNLNGGNGNDTLDGGVGNDTLTGGAGIDTYIVRDGNDTVNAYDLVSCWVDTLVLEGVNPGDIGLSKANNDLVLTKSNGETVRLYNYFAAANYQFAAIRFDDGTVWNTASVAAQSMQVNGTTGNDILTGRNGGSNFMNGYAGVDTLNGGDRNDILNGGEGNDTLTGNAGDDALDGGVGDDTLNGSDGTDTLIGGAGNDNLTGGIGNDTLDGGIGNDTLTGGAGVDTYIVRDGNDTINAYDAIGSWVDTLVLEGVNPADLGLSKTGNDLLLTKTNGETVHLYNYFAAANYQFAAIRFDDGTVWNTATVAAQSMQVNGGVGSDTLTGHDGGPNVMLGYAGADILNGGNGNDTLGGGDGNDTLNGNAGNDALQGDAGDDTLNGGVGNDTYLFGRGHGSDVVSDNDTTTGNTDVARFLTGISTDQIWLRHVGNNLEVSVIGTTDKLTVKDWYLGSRYRVEQFQTADNHVLIDSQVENLVQAMASFAPPAAGQTTLPQNYQDALGTVIATNWQTTP